MGQAGNRTPVSKAVRNPPGKVVMLMEFVFTLLVLITVLEIIKYIKK